MRVLFILLIIYANLSAAWVMFSDGVDTYIYNNANGDIYIRYKKGGKNYEDNFIKMPSGIILDKPDSTKKDYNTNDISQKMQDAQKQILDSVLSQ